MNNMKLLKLLSNSSFLAMSLTITLQTVFGALTEKPEDVVAKVGTRVVIKCSTDLPRPVKWSRLSPGSVSETDIYIGRGVFVPQFTDRFSIANNYSLVIKNVSLEDAGQYTCIDDHGFGLEKGEFGSSHLTVIGQEFTTSTGLSVSSTSSIGSISIATVFIAIFNVIAVFLLYRNRSKISMLCATIRRRRVNNKRSITATERDRLINDEIIYVEAINDEIINDEIINDDIINDETINEETINDEIINVEAINDEIINDEIINDEIINDEIINDEIINDEIINDETINDETINVETINVESTLRRRRVPGSVNVETTVRSQRVPRSVSEYRGNTVRLLSNYCWTSPLMSATNPEGAPEGYINEGPPGQVSIMDDSTSKQIIGITVVGDKVYVVRQGQKQINGYHIQDSRNHFKLPDIPMDDSHCLSGLAGCSENKALYISDIGLQCIHRVNLTNSFVTRWETGENLIPWGLSVRAGGTVLVTMWLSENEGEGSVVEYSSKGEPLREIMLDKSIKHAWQTVQLSSGQFFVSHGNDESTQGLTSSMHRVCMINPEGGAVIKYFGSEQGGGEGQLDHPVSISEEYFFNRIFVADCKNHRIILLDSNLECLGQVHVNHGCQLPYGLCFDPRSDQLYIGDELGRLLIGTSSVLDA